MLEDRLAERPSFGEVDALHDLGFEHGDAEGRGHFADVSPQNRI